MFFVGDQTFYICPIPPSNPDISISVTVDGEEEEEEGEGGEVDDGKTGSNVATGSSSSAQRRSRCVRQASLQVSPRPLQVQRLAHQALTL